MAKQSYFGLESMVIWEVQVVWFDRPPSPVIRVGLPILAKLAIVSADATHPTFRPDGDAMSKSR
ncbi:hypothetical protein, partial [Marivita sp.]|uniref:hypothetical protein n=1 Tax=Marivita sp. TaxID=2003365 RepID=UPI003F70F25B